MSQYLLVEQISSDETHTHTHTVNSRTASCFPVCCLGRALGSVAPPPGGNQHGIWGFSVCKLCRGTGLHTGRFTQTNTAGGMPVTSEFRKREIANMCSRGGTKGTSCSSTGLIARNTQQMWPSEAERSFAEKDYRIARVSKQ